VYTYPISPLRFPVELGMQVNARQRLHLVGDVNAHPLENRRTYTFHTVLGKPASSFLDVGIFGKQQIAVDVKPAPAVGIALVTDPATSAR
jgi:hypothetical protein